MKWHNKGKEFDEIGHKLHGKKRMIIYGAGMYAEDIINVYEGAGQYLSDWELQLIDRDKKKRENGMRGYRVYSPEVLFSQDNTDSFIVICATEENSAEIREGILQHGISENIVYQYEYFLYTYLPIYFMYEKDILFFSSQNIIPSTVCDLNCRSCLNFNPYIKKQIVDDVNSVKHDIDIFFSKVDLVYRLQISGGEPFLYKYLDEILQYIHDKYKERVIRLETVTNGTIVPTDRLCEILRSCDVTVFLDDYRKSLEDGDERYGKVKARLEQANIKVIYNYVEKWIRLYDEAFFHEEDGEGQLMALFDRCRNPWSTLRQGKITSCNYAHYAAKAGVVEDDVSNYCNLSTITDKKELLEFRLRYNEKGYVDFCRKCAGWTSINRHYEDAGIQKGCGDGKNV